MLQAEGPFRTTSQAALAVEDSAAPAASFEALVAFVAAQLRNVGGWIDVLHFVEQIRCGFALADGFQFVGDDARDDAGRASSSVSARPCS